MTTIGTNINASTGDFYARATGNLSGLRAKAEAIQVSIASGNRLAKSSDDPVAASRLRVLDRANSLAKVDTAAADRAAADLDLADSALSALTDLVGRSTELATQAATGTLSPAQRATIGNEIGQIQIAMVALANSRDSAGHALFGGDANGNAYAVDAAGNASYVGTAPAAPRDLGDGVSVAGGVTGPDILSFSVGGKPTDLLAVVKALSTALQGDTDPAGSARDALTALGTGLDTLTTQQTIVGTRLAWIDIVTDRQINSSETRATEQAAVGGTDLASSIAELQQFMTVLEASQASFAKLSSLSLFDQLR